MNWPGDPRAEEALHGLEGVLHRHAEHLGLVAVEVDEELLRRAAEGGGDAGELGPLARRCDERLHRLRSVARASPAPRFWM